MDSVLIPEGSALRQNNSQRPAQTPRNSGLEDLITGYTPAANSTATAVENDVITLTGQAAQKAHENFTMIDRSSQKSLESIIRSMLGTSVAFAIDQDSATSYIEVTDKVTNELLRTIPTEGMRKILENIDKNIAEMLNDNIEDPKGILLDTNS